MRWLRNGLTPAPGGGEPFDEGKTSLGQGDPVGEVVLGVQCRGEPVAEPPDHPGRAEDEAIQRDGCLGGRGPLAGGPPMDEFGFWGRELNLQLVPPPRQGTEEALEAAYVGAVGGRSDRQGEIVHVEQHDPSGYGRVEGGYVYEEQEGGYGGTLWGPHFDGGSCPGGALENQGAGAFRKE